MLLPKFLIIEDKHFVVGDQRICFFKWKFANEHSKKHYPKSKDVSLTCVVWKLLSHYFRCLVTKKKINKMKLKIINPGVPIISDEINFVVVAKPKSINFISNYLSKTKFSHFMSLCIIPFKCKYSNANFKTLKKNKFLPSSI